MKRSIHALFRIILEVGRTFLGRNYYILAVLMLQSNAKIVLWQDLYHFECTTCQTKLSSIMKTNIFYGIKLFLYFQKTKFPIIHSRSSTFDPSYITRQVMKSFQMTTILNIKIENKFCAGPPHRSTLSPPCKQRSIYKRVLMVYFWDIPWN